MVDGQEEQLAMTQGESVEGEINAKAEIRRFGKWMSVSVVYD